jgi:PAS domain S-box-containing protein
MTTQTALEFKALSKPVSARLLEQIADSVPALVALYNINSGEYIYVNKAITKLLGYTPQEFIEGGVEFAVSIMHPDDVGKIMQKNQQALDEANANSDVQDEPIVNFEYRMRHKDGAWRWLHTDGTIFSRSSTGKVELLLNASLDITDRKKAEMQLKRSMQALESVLASG